MTTANRSTTRTAFLASTLGSDRLAELLGVGRSQPTRWIEGVDQPSPTHARKLVDLEHVLERALLLWTRPVAIAWLTGANSYLAGARPIEVLMERGPSAVLDALDAAEAGVIN